MKKIYPFKFLDSYTQEDKDIFFGRAEEIEQLYDMLFQSDLLLIYGASGTGKTSLIQCGLANKFKSFDWFPIAIRRKSNLNDAIEEALTRAIGTADKADTDDDFENMFLEEEAPVSPLEQKLKDIYLQHFRPIYLIFDQFEELYVLGSKEEQEKFVQTVKEIMQIEQPIKILLSIREEYLGLLYEFEKAVPELLRKKLRIEAMNLDKVKQVLEGIDQNPHTIVKLEGTAQEKQNFTEEIFQKVQGDEKGLFIQLPYLQVFLDKLYRQITQDETFQQEATFNLAELQKIGDIGNVLRDFLEEQVIRIAQKLKEKDENIWKILSPFATLEGTKEPLSEEMLKERLTPDLQKLTTKVISAFENARILRFSEKDGLYEITHDTLAKQIASKRSDEDIAILEIQTLIKNQLAFGKDLFSKKQLSVIVPYQDKLNLNSKEIQLIQDSQEEIEKQEENERKKKRSLALNRWVAIGATLGLLIALFLALFAIIQSFEARKKETIAIVAEKKAKKREKGASEEKKKANRNSRKATLSMRQAKIDTKITRIEAKTAEVEILEAEMIKTEAMLIIRNASEGKEVSNVLANDSIRNKFEGEILPKAEDILNDIHSTAEDIKKLMGVLDFYDDDELQTMLNMQNDLKDIRISLEEKLKAMGLWDKLSPKSKRVIDFNNK